jgi:hypothetical protein
VEQQLVKEVLERLQKMGWLDGYFERRLEMSASLFQKD